MNKIVRIFSYLFDLLYGATKYPCAWFKPKVFYGVFDGTTTNNYQKIFYQELRQFGFRRTFWQLVFPGQIAGVVKKVHPKLNGANEYHVRFYTNGTIDCEIEVDRFSELHWSGHREHDLDFLVDALTKSSLPNDVKKNIIPLFKATKFSDNCTRVKPICTG